MTVTDFFMEVYREQFPWLAPVAVAVRWLDKCAWNGAAVDDPSFLERFCRLEFGDRTGALAAALSALGRRGWPPPQGRDERSVLYYGLVERVRRPPGEEVWPWGWWWKAMAR